MWSVAETQRKRVFDDGWLVFVFVVEGEGQGDGFTVGGGEPDHHVGTERKPNFAAFLITQAVRIGFGCDKFALDRRDGQVLGVDNLGFQSCAGGEFGEIVAAGREIKFPFGRHFFAEIYKVVARTAD